MSHNYLKRANYLYAYTMKVALIAAQSIVLYLGFELKPMSSGISPPW